MRIYAAQGEPGVDESVSARETQPNPNEWTEDVQGCPGMGLGRINDFSYQLVIISRWYFTDLYAIYMPFISVGFFHNPVISHEHMPFRKVGDISPIDNLLILTICLGRRNMKSWKLWRMGWVTRDDPPPKTNMAMEMHLFQYTNTSSYGGFSSQSC